MPPASYVTGLSSFSVCLGLGKDRQGQLVGYPTYGAKLVLGAKLLELSSRPKEFSYAKNDCCILLGLHCWRVFRLGRYGPTKAGRVYRRYI